MPLLVRSFEVHPMACIAVNSLYLIGYYQLYTYVCTWECVNKEERKRKGIKVEAKTKAMNQRARN